MAVLDAHDAQDVRGARDGAASDRSRAAVTARLAQVIQRHPRAVPAAHLGALAAADTAFVAPVLLAKGCRRFWVDTVAEALTLQELLYARCVEAPIRIVSGPRNLPPFRDFDEASISAALQDFYGKPLPYEPDFEGLVPLLATREDVTWWFRHRGETLAGAALDLRAELASEVEAHVASAGRAGGPLLVATPDAEGSVSAAVERVAQAVERFGAVSREPGAAVLADGLVALPELAHGLRWEVAFRPLAE